jgi:tetratricopeptide (TPR) repeat protein
LYQSAISLAISSGNTKQHARALYDIAWMKWQLGDYSGSQSTAYEFQRLAKSSGDLCAEAESLRMIAICLHTWGNYRESISLLQRAVDLIGLCGMASSILKHDILSSQAEAHRFKSEYLEAYNIQTQILHEAYLNQDSFFPGTTTLNIAQLQISMDTPKPEVQKNIDAAKALIIGDHRMVMFCEFLQGDLNLKEGYSVDADMVLCKTLQVSWRNAADIVTYCLESLADFVRWNGFHGVSPWPTVFLVHSLVSREKLGIHKALQFLGDLFLRQDDKDTAVSLFTVALEGFTYMDVHRSRAECMLRLGDISKGHGDLLKAVELWEKAKPLFEQSSQSKQVKNIDQRLASVDEDVREQYRASLVHLAELNVPSGTVEKVDYEDLEVFNFDDE